LAIQNYQDTYGQPPADILDKDGRPLLSWRVQILPFLAGRLYGEFHMDEPWDSPHNLALVAKMPSVYNGYASSTPGSCGFLAVRSTEDELATGAVRATGKQSRKVILVQVDKEHAVPWTKPADLNFDPSDPGRGIVRLCSRSDPFPVRGGFALFDDGVVRLLSPDMDPDLLRSVLDADGPKARLDRPCYEALAVPQAREWLIPWLVIFTLAVGGALRVFHRIAQSKDLVPGEVLWLAVGCAYFAHAAAVLIGYRYTPVPRALQEWGLKRLFWFPPAAIATLVCFIGVAWSGFSARWRLLFAVATVLFGVDALDAWHPHQLRCVEESFVTAFLPVVTAGIGLAAGWLTVKDHTGSLPRRRRLAHWIGIAVFLLPSVWFAVCWFLGQAELRPLFGRIIVID
jgi:hypothetical protein